MGKHFLINEDPSLHTWEHKTIQAKYLYFLFFIFYFFVEMILHSMVTDSPNEPKFESCLDEVSHVRTNIRKRKLNTARARARAQNAMDHNVAKFH